MVLFIVRVPTDCKLLIVTSAVEVCEVIEVSPVTSIMLIVAPPVSVRTRFSTADILGRRLTAVIVAVRVSVPPPPVMESNVFQLFEVEPSIDESSVLPANDTVLAPTVRVAVVVSGVSEVSATLTDADSPATAQYLAHPMPT